MIINLPRRLEAWVREGLLNAPQAKAIVEFEKAESTPWAMYGLAGIGVTTILTGIVSLIAANWDELGDVVKLAGYFLLQVGLGLWFLKQEKKPGVWRETAVTLFAFGFLAGIGLVSQIFHLSGDGWRALSLWLVLTLVAVLQAESKLLNHAWMLILLYTAGVWATGTREPGMRVSIAASIPIALTGLGFLSERWFRFPEAFRTATLLWGLASTLLSGTILGNVLWIVLDRHDTDKIAEYLYIPWLVLIGTAVASLLRGPRTSKALKMGTAILLLIWGVYVTVPLLSTFPDGLSKVGRQLFGAGGFLLIGSLTAVSAALGGQRRLYDLATFVIAARLVCIYFEVFGSLANTGIGLIFTGIVILGLARVWQKHRTVLVKWLEARQ